MMLFKKSAAIVLFLLVTMMTSVSSVVVASEVPPEKVVIDATQKVLDLIQSDKTLYQKDPAAFFGHVDAAIDPIVAFELMSRGVMGKYAHRATEQQLADFTKVFRTSMVEFYGKAVMTFDTSSLRITRVDRVTKELLDEYRAKKSRTIPVNMKIRSGNQEYTMTYSVVDVDGSWKVRNIVVEGINIGVQFRNQFGTAMQSYKKVDKVIENWAEIMNQADGKGN